MIVKYILASVMLTNAIIAMIIAISVLLSYERRFTDNKILALVSICSSIWSFGFGMLILQESPDLAYICRSLGISGTIGYMVTAQMLIVSISGLSERKGKIFLYMALLGVPIYFLAIQRRQTVYIMTGIGMTYQFVPNFINNLYTFYFLAIAFNIFIIILYMIYRSPLRRIKYFGRRFLIVEILVLIGTVLDVIFPLFELPAIPGSIITQFWALVILCQAMGKINASRVNSKNMSEYVYFSLRNAVLVFDGNKNLKIANDAAADFLELDKLLPNAMHGYREQICDLFDAKESEIFTFEGDHKRIDATCIKNNVKCNLEISKIKDEYGDLIGFILMVNDLTERIQYMNSLEEAKKEADFANQAKSIFLANMSHEIRTPMNAIMGFAELALQENDEKLLKEYLADIRQSSEGLLGIINDILNITKIESGKLELVNNEYDVCKLLKPLYQMTKQLAEKKKLELYLNVSKDIPKFLYGDELRIKEILLNLINNSIKYTEHGSVTISIDVIEKLAGEATLRYTIKDTGMGIKEEDIPYLFGTFRRLDEERNRHIEGTGLGLSIVKGYIDLMEGDIRVESIYGMGSKFIVTLKQKIVSDEHISMEEIFGVSEAEESSFGKLTFNNERVLVVDDNEVNIRVMEKTLEAYGLKADTALNGPDAIRLCSVNKYPIIFMDQMMPEMDGEETMMIIRDTIGFYKEDGKIVMLTANAFDKVKDEALEKGFDDYLKKPLEYKELERVLKTYLTAQTKEEEEIPEEVSTNEEKTENQENQKLELLDTNEGIAHCAGSKDIYKTVLAVAVKNEEKDIAKLLEAYEAKDFVTVGIQAHAMKGSCLNLGANKTGEYARQMEFAGKEANKEFLQENMDNFITEYRALIKEIRNYIETQ